MSIVEMQVANKTQSIIEQYGNKENFIIKMVRQAWIKGCTIAERLMKVNQDKEIAQSLKQQEPEKKEISMNQRTIQLLTDLPRLMDGKCHDIDELKQRIIKRRHLKKPQVKLILSLDQERLNITEIFNKFRQKQRIMKQKQKLKISRDQFKEYQINQNDKNKIKNTKSVGDLSILLQEQKQRQEEREENIIKKIIDESKKQQEKHNEKEKNNQFEQKVCLIQINKIQNKKQEIQDEKLAISNKNQQKWQKQQKQQKQIIVSNCKQQQKPYNDHSTILQSSYQEDKKIIQANKKQQNTLKMNPFLAKSTIQKYQNRKNLLNEIIKQTKNHIFHNKQSSLPLITSSVHHNQHNNKLFQKKQLCSPFQQKPFNNHLSQEINLFSKLQHQHKSFNNNHCLNSNFDFSLTNQKKLNLQQFSAPLSTPNPFINIQQSSSFSPFFLNKDQKISQIQVKKNQKLLQSFIKPKQKIQNQLQSGFLLSKFNPIINDSECKTQRKSTNRRKNKKEQRIRG